MGRKANIDGGYVESARSEQLERCEEIALFIIEEGCTVRTAAKRFGVSKSTVHKDVAERLKAVNLNLYGEARKILERNKAERHLRGGEATRRKYLLEAQTVNSASPPAVTENSGKADNGSSIVSEMEKA